MSWAAEQEGRARGLSGRRLEDFIQSWRVNPKAGKGRRAKLYKKVDPDLHKRMEEFKRGSQEKVQAD